MPNGTIQDSRQQPIGPGKTGEDRKPDWGYIKVHDPQNDTDYEWNEYILYLNSKHVPDATPGKKCKYDHSIATLVYHDGYKELERKIKFATIKEIID